MCWIDTLARWPTAAWSSRRPDGTSRGSGCWKPSGSTPGTACVDSGGWAEAHERHAAYYLALAEPAGSELSGEGSWPG